MPLPASAPLAREHISYHYTGTLIRWIARMALREQLETQLGETYRIERELSGGGMSRVFVAEERTLGRRVVIKVLPPELSGGINLERFKREIQLAASLQHPHIVPVFSAGDVDGVPYFTMPFVEGESLRATLSRGELPIAEAVSVLRDVSRALAYAHAHGVVHRDIKPDNVLLSAHAATVTDFGVAKALTASTSPGESLTATGVALGTPAYMSPEQAAADPNVDARADIYAVGCLAYEMLSGDPPFTGRTAQNLVSAHLSQTPVPVVQRRESIPAELGSLVMRCLAKRPADRPQTAEELLQSLESLGTPTAGMPPARARRSSRSRVLAMAVVAASVVVVFASVMVASRWRGTSAPSPNAAVVPQAQPPKFRPTSIVVAPFTNMTGDTSLNVLGAIAAHTLTDGLSELDSVTVMSPDAGILDSTGGLRRIAGLDAVRRLGRESKAASVVWGSYYREGDSIRVQTQIIDVNDGRVQVTLRPVTASAKSPTGGLQELREHLVNAIDATKLAKTLGSIGPPPNMAAYREFVLGLHERWEVGTDSSALPYFEHASRLDTTFTMATHYVVLTHSNWARTTNRQRRLSHNQSADSAVAILAKRRAGMSSLELELLENSQAMASGNAVALLQSVQKLLRRDSSSRLVNNLGDAAWRGNRPGAAERVLRTWPDSLVPPTMTSYLNNACHVFHELGDYKAQRAIGVRWAARTKSFSPVACQLEADFALGDLVHANRVIDSLTAAAADPAATPYSNMANAAAELRAHGHEAEAKALIEQALRAFAARSRAPSVGALLGVARLQFFNGNLDSARMLAEPAAARDTTYSGARVFLGQVAAARGDTVTALRTLAVLDSVGRNKYDHGYAKVDQARILAQLGRKAEAVRMLNQAMAAGAPFDLGVSAWHADPAFAPLRDFPPFKELLRPK